MREFLDALKWYQQAKTKTKILRRIMKWVSTHRGHCEDSVGNPRGGGCGHCS